MPRRFGRFSRWSLFVVAATCAFSCSLLSAAEQMANASPAPVALVTEWMPRNRKEGLSWQPMFRELARQALLITAREELSLSTRDQTLGEKLPSDKLLHVEARGFSDDKYTLRIALLPPDRADRPTIAAGKEKWKTELKYSADGNGYVTLVPQLEKLSRGEFVTVLHDLGYQKAEPGPKATEFDREPLLANMDFVSQFAAVREAHRATKRGDDPIGAIGSLVRGYANLALLTDHYWSSMSDVFAARALLYAERMVVLSKESKTARWHRAYARALVGLHGAALEDIKALCDNKPSAGPPASDGKPSDLTEKQRAAVTANVSKLQSDRLPADAPAWARLLIEYCQYDRKRLLKLETPPELQQLANLLAFDIQCTYDRQDWLAAAGKEAAEKCPEAFCIVDQIANAGEMGDSRWASSAVMESFASLLPNRIVESDLLSSDAATKLSAEVDKNVRIPSPRQSMYRRQRSRRSATRCASWDRKAKGNPR